MTCKSLRRYFIELYINYAKILVIFFLYLIPYLKCFEIKVSILAYKILFEAIQLKLIFALNDYRTYDPLY